MDEASVLSSFSASSSTVLNKVNERKRAEAEVALLANRLQHLRNEHARTRQRMETTRSRTREPTHTQTHMCRHTTTHHHRR